MRRFEVAGEKPRSVGKGVPCFFIFIPFCLLLFAFSAIAQKTNEAVKQGNEAYRKNDYTTAIKSYEKALQADGKNLAAKFNMANALQKENSNDKAADNYDDVIANTTDAALQSKAYYNKALAMLQNNKLDAAIDEFKQSLRLSPTDNDTRENLQKAMTVKKQQQEQQNQNKKEQPQQQQQQKKQQQKQQPKMNKQMMEQKFKELQDQEKQLQKELQKQKTNQPDAEKDW